MIQRPKQSEYNPYFEKYISLIPKGDFLEFLKKQDEELQSLLQDVSNEQGEYRYAPGKWSLKEVLGHMADAERVMSYRLLAVCRGETTSMPSFDPNAYVKNAACNRFSVAELLSDLAHLRACTHSLIKGLTNESLSRVGNVSGNVTSALAIAYILAGHGQHHLSIIKEKYL